MRTVQGVLEATLGSLLGNRLSVHGAARTDRGVHARAQVAHFASPPALAAGDARASFLAALSSALPTSLRATRLEPASASFHARSSAVGKRYAYRFRWGLHEKRGAAGTGGTHDAPEAPRAEADLAAEAADDPSRWHLGLSAAPDWERARAALAGLDGLHELPGLSSPSTDRRPAPALSSWRLDESAGEAVLELSAAAFRKHQVRNVAGHLAAIALGLAAPETLAALSQRKRPWMGATAPPHGLCLEEVRYPEALDPFRVC
jgi:tRNA pseudouridine38-40 synthase